MANLSKNKGIAWTFQHVVIELALDRIVPLKVISPAIRQSSKYLQVKASVKAVGVIEPLVVCRESARSRTYCLVDGHLRYDALKHLKHTETTCLVTTDKDTFTYNHKVQHVQPIQQHRMITRAVEQGVPEREIAKALNIDVSRVRLKRQLLDGVCPEAVKILEGHNVPARTIHLMRQAKSIRQIEMAELMVLTNKYTSTYARFLVSATPDERLIAPERTRDKKLNGSDLAKIEREMQRINCDLKSLEGSYGENVLHLVVIARYVQSLVDNTRVHRHLAKHYGNYLIEFERLIEMPEIRDSDSPTLDSGGETDGDAEGK